MCFSFFAFFWRLLWIDVYRLMVTKPIQYFVMIKYFFIYALIMQIGIMTVLLIQYEIPKMNFEIKINVIYESKFETLINWSFFHQLFLLFLGYKLFINSFTYFLYKHVYPFISVEHAVRLWIPGTIYLKNITFTVSESNLRNGYKEIMKNENLAKQLGKSSWYNSILSYRLVLSLWDDFLYLMMASNNWNCFMLYKNGFQILH